MEWQAVMSSAVGVAVVCKAEVGLDYMPCAKSLRLFVQQQNQRHYHCYTRQTIFFHSTLMHRTALSFLGEEMPVRLFDIRVLVLAGLHEEALVLLEILTIIVAAVCAAGFHEQASQLDGHGCVPLT